jgi:hypothetical protein
MRDPKGDEQLQRFMSWFLPQYQQQRQSGKTAVQLLNPDSPDYLGKGLQQFTRPRAQMMKDIVDSNPETFGGEATGLKPPEVGEVRDGYKFKGGPPKDPNSWEPVSGGQRASAAPAVPIIGAQP